MDHHAVLLAVLLCYFLSYTNKVQCTKKEFANRPNTYLAIARTKVGPSKYLGVGGSIKLDNPKVNGQQYSATRIKLQAGPNSIEAGWRVDPSLYGDSHTRLFIRTDAGKTHCFNDLCPGFIKTFHGDTWDVPLKKISIPGGPAYSLRYDIVKDNRTGNWNFILGSDLIGYWPSHIFTGLANHVEWGGAAYSPPGTPLPPMGSGNHPIVDHLYDGLIHDLKVTNERGQTVEPLHLETYADNSKFYSVRDIGYKGRMWGHVILYGGPGHQ